MGQELAHRMKNVLSVVGSLVALSGEHRPEARNFVTAFQARLGSLAATHELLVQTEWRPIVLGRLVEKVLGPLGALDRVTMVGNQAFLLASHDAQTLALVLHELATNAIKYGALSNGHGRVLLAIEVKWDRLRDEQPLLILRWEESGGPAVTAPSAKGFGLTLLERLTRRHDQADQTLDWRVSGLHCCVSLHVVPVRPSVQGTHPSGHNDNLRVVRRRRRASCRKQSARMIVLLSQPFLASSGVRRCPSSHSPPAFWQQPSSSPSPPHMPRSRHGRISSSTR